MERRYITIRKIAVICLTTVIAFMIGITKPQALGHNITNYFGVTMTLDEYMNLYNLGFSEDEIYYMPRDIFEENKDADSELLVSTTKYYKTIYPTYGNSYTVEVTENEYYNHGGENLLSTVITEYHTITSVIAANGQRYRYKVTMSWNGLPSVHSYDVIAVGFDDLVHIATVATFYNIYTTSANQTLYSTDLLL